MKNQLFVSRNSETQSKCCIVHEIELRNLFFNWRSNLTQIYYKLTVLNNMVAA
jgi:hypothetical protein